MIVDPRRLAGNCRTAGKIAIQFSRWRLKRNCFLGSGEPECSGFGGWRLPIDDVAIGAAALPHCMKRVGGSERLASGPGRTYFTDVSDINRNLCPERALEMVKTWARQVYGITVY